jgi:hypothetical protein
VQKHMATSDRESKHDGLISCNDTIPDKTMVFYTPMLCIKLNLIIIDYFSHYKRLT